MGENWDLQLFIGALMLVIALTGVLNTCNAPNAPSGWDAINPLTWAGYASSSAAYGACGFQFSIVNLVITVLGLVLMIVGVLNLAEIKIW
jgi:hypothetical protein